MNRPARIPPWDQMHYRLVSLWDIIMYSLKADKIIKAIDWLISYQQSLSLLEDKQPTDPTHIIISDYETMMGLIGELKEAAKEMDLDGLFSCVCDLEEAAGRAHKTETLASFSVINWRRLLSQLRALSSRIPTDFASRRVLVVPVSKAQFYQPDEPAFGTQFGPEVAAKFKKKGKHEIGEAANCLALGRDTACVFHLMRAVETGLEGINACLQLPSLDTLKPGEKTWVPFSDG